MKLAWSNLAQQELRELRRFSVKRWGVDVALRYLEDVRDAARRAAVDTSRAKTLDERFRIIRVRSHYLILHVDPAADRLTVVRVLHTAMDRTPPAMKSGGESIQRATIVGVFLSAALRKSAADASHSAPKTLVPMTTS